ncbi:MAG: tRNA (guanosine(46)-N7)-methyltransferase TrmB [Clostridia bacterium]|nr:tRNA (guanosine(46)-N7)-methyltransferase TrmB [Clostridia bacterium]
MRMRKKKHLDSRLDACRSLLCEKPQEPVLSSVLHFGKESPLHLEIGCGKGGFACGMAEKHPDICFYAMERIPNVITNAVEKAIAEEEKRPTDNLRFIIGNAETLLEWFAPHSIDMLYLNFSDPWPKERHAKRRLTHRRFLSLYFEILNPRGEIILKTDNVNLFAFTLEELEALHITPSVVTHDLHHSPYAADNVMTEYERNFSEKGFPIHLVRFSSPLCQ